MEVNSHLSKEKYPKAIVLLISIISAQLFQACNSEITTHNKDQVMQLTPEYSNGGAIVDGGNGSVTREHNINTQPTNIDTISTDTTSNAIIKTDSVLTDSINNKSYSPFENIINDPTTPDQIEQNIEYMEVQIKRSKNPKALMMIALSEHCNTYLIINIAKNLKASDNLTEKRKKILSQLFKQRLDQESKNNPFDDEIDEILKKGRINTLNKTLNLKQTSTQNPDN